MAYPLQTFPDFASLLTYINNEWITNGNEDIDAVIGNNVVNGLLTFVEQSPLNYQKAQIISAGGTVTGTRPVVVFMSTTPTSLSWVDNIYNQYIFVNTTTNPIPLASGVVYYDINLNAQTSIPALSVVNIGKASNSGWITLGATGGSGGGSLYQTLSDTITTMGTEYQNDDLIGADEVKFLFLSKQYYELVSGDFTFDPALGKIIFTSTTLFPTYTITIPYSKTL